MFKYVCVLLCVFAHMGGWSVHVCGCVDQKTIPAASPLKSGMCIFFFHEIESLIGLEFNEKARVTGQQAQESTRFRLSTSGMTSMHYVWHFSQDLEVILSSSC